MVLACSKGWRCRGAVYEQYISGATYASGDGVRQNDREAVKWYRPAAQGGDKHAQLLLGTVPCNRNTAVEQDVALGVKRFQLSALQGKEEAVAKRDEVQQQHTIPLSTIPVRRLSPPPGYVHIMLPCSSLGGPSRVYSSSLIFGHHRSQTTSTRTIQ